MQRTELALLAYTASGAALAARLQEVLGDRCRVYLHSAHAAKDKEQRPGTTHFSDTGKLLDAVWGQTDAILYISAAGIAVRTIAPYLSSKSTDPAVLCMDDTARYVIPLASGHLGGANEWAERIAAFFGAEPVITTSTDRHGLFAVDLFAKEHRLVCTDPEKIRKISGALLAGEKVGYCCDEKYASLLSGCSDLACCGYILKGVSPESFRGTPLNSLPDGQARPACGITLTEDPFLPAQFEQECRLMPRNIYLGIGCRKGKSAQEIREAAKEALGQQGICLERVCTVASIDCKKEEAGLSAFARELRAEFVTFTPQELMGVSGDFAKSQFVRETVGADNVCERSACLASGGELVVRKYAFNGITIAAARSGT